MKTKIVLLGMLMASAVAASLQAAPSQPGATGRVSTGEFSQWAQDEKSDDWCICNTKAGIASCGKAENCQLPNKCVAPCKRW